MEFQGEAEVLILPVPECPRLHPKFFQGERRYVLSTLPVHLVCHLECLVFENFERVRDLPGAASQLNSIILGGHLAAGRRQS